MFVSEKHKVTSNPMNVNMVARNTNNLIQFPDCVFKSATFRAWYAGKCICFQSRKFVYRMVSTGILLVKIK